MSLEILTNLSASILVACSSHCLLLFHPLINRLDTAGFSDLLASHSVYFCFADYFSYYSHLICFQHLSVFFFFYVSVLVSSVYVIIGRKVALYIFDFVSFLIYLFLQTRSFKQPVTLAAHSCCFLSLCFNLFYQIS